MEDKFMTLWKLKKQEKNFVLPYYWNFYDSSDSITEPILSDTIILIKKMWFVK